ncbi:MAG: hypothetical protein QXT19_02485 [Candidatus Woesearchaeota archaeon]
MLRHYQHSIPGFVTVFPIIEEPTEKRPLEDALGKAYDQLPGFVRVQGTGSHSGGSTGKPSSKRQKSLEEQGEEENIKRQNHCRMAQAVLD